MYPVYRAYFDARKSVSSPLTMDMSTTYDSASRQGSLTVVVRNPGASPVSGQLQVALTESHLYYVWQGLDSVHHVERAMLPNASGEAVTVPAYDSVVKTRDFTVNSNWVARNCNLIAFVQNNSTKEIYQGARTAVQPEPVVKYLGYQTVYPQPGQSASLVIGLANRGMAGATGVSAVLSTSDPYATVTTPGAGFADIARGGSGYSLTPFQIDVASGCPDPYLATLNLAVTSGGHVDNASFPLNIATAPGFSDGMESGTNGWTHGGIQDQWHQTTHRFHWGSSSWYCGTEGGWQYTSENDASLITPYFTLGNQTNVGFFHYDTTERNFDYSLVEINNGSDFWSQLGSYTGFTHGWQQVEYAVPDYLGQTVRVRFRFLSDYNVTAEGWYVDDFYAGVAAGEAEKPVAATGRLSLAAGRNPVNDAAVLSYQIPVGRKALLAIYDATGSRVAEFGGLQAAGRLSWNLRDASGVAVRSGTYFARLVSFAGSASVRLVVAR